MGIPWGYWLGGGITAWGVAEEDTGVAMLGIIMMGVTAWLRFEFAGPL